MVKIPDRFLKTFLKRESTGGGVQPIFAVTGPRPRRWTVLKQSQHVHVLEEEGSGYRPPPPPY